MSNILYKIPRLPLFCQIIIGENILRNISKVANLDNWSQFIIIADKKLNILSLKLIKSLKQTKKPIHLIKLQALEKTKTEKQADKILNKILKIKPPIDRKILVLALGGGVVGDMAGYIAGRVLRGVDYFQIPTTLLAMVDSSLGGKTAVDFEEITNMIGLFHLPKAVIMDIDVLKTLPSRQWRSGMAELVKHAFLEPKLSGLLSRTSSKELKTNSKKLIAALKLSCQYKMNIVQKDFEERKNIRKVLNFGHTIGRALETATGLTRFTHGEAVAIGMAGAILISHRKGLLSDQKMNKMLEMMERFNLPIKTSGIDLGLLWQAISRDKKAINGVPRFVLLEGVGKPKVDCQVDEEIINKVLKEIIS